MSGEVCSVCGRSVDSAGEGDPPLAWSTEADPSAGPGSVRRLCPACTRQHVRSIEAKLDPDWW